MFFLLWLAAGALTFAFDLRLYRVRASMGRGEDRGYFDDVKRIETDAQHQFPQLSESLIRNGIVTAETILAAFKVLGWPVVLAAHTRHVVNLFRARRAARRVIRLLASRNDEPSKRATALMEALAHNTKIFTRRPPIPYSPTEPHAP